MKTILSFFILLIFSCKNNTTTTAPQVAADTTHPTTKVVLSPIENPGNIYPWMNYYSSEDAIINQIPVPDNFKRIKTESGTFQNWLQFLPLFSKGKKVKLFNGELKYNQNVHVRVVNLDVGKRDLQQCADAVMRMRSEFFYSKNEFDKIHFNYTNGTNVSFEDWRNGRRPIVKGNKVTFSEGNKKDDSYPNFKKYLIQIFNYAGTASLEKEMKSIALTEMKIGDVFIQGGHPGHAVLVVDMAENPQGEKIYLLAQSYMPAQEFHILKNIDYPDISPWYTLDTSTDIPTPEWNFSSNDLRRFVD